ncbi:MAG: YkgJ family cysteine cluster protein [Candidatus Hodarchaeota archaeon]
MRAPSEICLSCGQCCNDHNLAPFLFPQDAILLASKGFGDPLCLENNDNNEPEIRLHTRLNGDCLFFNRSTNKCQIYANRPIVCQIFPYGEDEEANADSDSREKWIMENCALFIEYGVESSLRIAAMKLMANARRLEYQLSSRAIRFVRGLIQDREAKLEEQWGFRKTSDYGLTYWARENAPVEEIINWLSKKSQRIQKARIGANLTVYDRHYRALCTIQGVFHGNSRSANQWTVPTSHEELLNALDDFFNPDKSADLCFLEGWEPWPPDKNNLLAASDRRKDSNTSP